MRTFPLSFVLLLAGLVSTTPPAGAEHPNHAQGLRAEHAFQTDGIENVNLFNGNLTLRIPIGPSYAVGPELSYGLTLVYTGNVWEWDEEVDADGINEVYLQAKPRSLSNAGLGWDLSLGRFLGASSPANPSPNPVYQSPDQGTHELIDRRLHPNGELFASGNRFSQDSTYLRYKTSGQELNLPNGVKQLFGPDGPTRIIDPFGNSVDVDFNTVNAQGKPTWTITDLHGRTHVVTFGTLSGRKVVTKVELEKFGGGTKATYVFSYGTRSLPRACNFPQSCFGGNGVCGDTSNTSVPVLTQVQLPDASTYQMPLASYRLDSSMQCNDRLLNGSLERLVLPTGGAFEWDWTAVVFPQESADVEGGVLQGNQPGNPFTLAAGVSQRRWMTRSGGTLGHWDYSRQLTSCPGETALCELIVTVTNAPPGDSTKHFFSAYPGRAIGSGLTDPAGGWTKYEYGLPFTRKTSDQTTPGRYKSIEVYDKNGAKVRTGYVRYELSATGSKANPRVVSTRTVHHDDAGRRADVDLSDFDGLGHYRRSITGGSFPSDNVRESHTELNPGKSIADTPNPTEPWVLGTWTTQWTRQGTRTVTREADFDPATGFLRRTRARKSAACGTEDVVVVRQGTAGFPTKETSYGGYGSSLPCGALKDVSLTGQAIRFEQRHTWQQGSLATSRWWRPNGTSLSFLSVDRTIDPWTGLPSSSREPAGLQTTYTYDPLGRVTKEDRATGHGADTVYTYSLSSGTEPRRVLIQAKDGSTVVSEGEVRLDDFGRVAEERRRMPDGTWSVQTTDWSSRGWIDQRSEWFLLGGSKSQTLFRQYDPFGRPESITLPDGLSISVDFKGVGSRTVTIPVATALDAGNNPLLGNATSTETYDRFGQLFRVTEPNGTRTSYTYDPTGNLTQVKQNDLGATIQTRTFAYDDRGFLTSETHPELGSAITYSRHDALGNPGRIQRGGWDLTHVYDAAARPLEVKETANGRIWKSWSWATGNSQAGTWSNGKLLSTLRLNRIPYPPSPSTIIETPVTESYQYNGVGGRISKVTTDVAVGGNPHFEYSLSYDPLGNVTNRTYPQCTHGFCSQANVLRTVTPTYSNGFLTGIPGYATSVTYHPNGLWAQIAHAHGVNDVLAKDPDDMMRPLSISTSGASVNYSSGIYAYDGAGNITKMGSERFVYDSLSRIVDANLILDQSGSPTAGQSYTYDVFGNLLSMTTERQGQANQTRAIGTHAATNRMSVAGYDLSGNVTSWAGRAYSYDPFDMVYETNGFSFVYGPGDERLWTIDWSAGTAVTSWVETWSLRDLDGTVLREYRSVGGNNSGAWSLHRDYVHGPAGLLAAVTPQGTRHFHTDHLGSPRIVTSTTKTTLARHEYFPFGEEATSPTQDDHRLKFTGHERDDTDSGGTTGDLDYMHARYFSAHTGRFLSTDPVGGVPSHPQTWNLYGYALGNPVKYVDPEGLAPIDFCSSSGSDEEQAGSCVGTIDVIGEEPENDGPGFDLMTGAQGLGDLQSGGGLLRDASNLNNLPHLPASMRGMTFRQGLDLAIASGAGGDCASDPNCILLSEAAKALDNPLFQSIRAAQLAGLVVVTASGVPGAWRGGEWVFTKNFRISPFGHNGGFTGRGGGPWFRRLPHYHHRGPGGIGRHRPWESGPR